MANKISAKHDNSVKKEAFTLGSVLASMNREIGIDMGTANTVIYMKGKGIVLREPTLVAVDRHNDEIVAVGKDAKEMIGKTPSQVVIIQPVKSGMVADFDPCCAMLKAFVKKAASANIISRPRVLLSIPAGATEIERIAAEDVVKHSGAGDISLIEAPLAAVVGAGLSPVSPKGFMTVNMGAGIIEVAVIALGDVLASTTIRSAGKAIDEAIARYIKRKYGLQIGENTAEDVKLKIGSAFPMENSFSAFLEVRGRSVSDNLPKSVTVHADEIREPILEVLAGLISAIEHTTENLPPEIAADLLEQGMLLTGGGALLSGLDRYLKETTGLNVAVCERPIDALAEGLGRSLDAVAKKREARRN